MMLPPDLFCVIRITVIAGMAAWAVQVAAKTILRLY